MWCSKALVAYDGSAPSMKAVELAREIAADEPETTFLFVSVVRLYSSGSAAMGMDTVVAADAEPIRQDLLRAAESLPNVTEVRLLKGSSPADLIVRCAQDEGCDLIIMGSRGQGGVKGYLGSVSRAVVQSSPITVLVAKGEPGAAR